MNNNKRQWINHNQMLHAYAGFFSRFADHHHPLHPIISLPNLHSSINSHWYGGKKIATQQQL